MRFMLANKFFLLLLVDNFFKKKKTVNVFNFFFPTSIADQGLLRVFNEGNSKKGKYSFKLFFINTIVLPYSHIAVSIFFFTWNLSKITTIYHFGSILSPPKVLTFFGTWVNITQPQWNLSSLCEHLFHSLRLSGVQSRQQVICSDEFIGSSCFRSGHLDPRRLVAAQQAIAGARGVLHKQVEQTPNVALKNRRKEYPVFLYICYRAGYEFQ